MPTNPEDHQTLKIEARLFSNYLINREPEGDIIARYIDANLKLGTDAVSDNDAGILRYCMSHKWSVSLLDAATGLLHPRSVLRKKIYIMAALLEASTKYTECFLPGDQSVIAAIIEIMSAGMFACIKILLGVPLYYVLRGRS